MSDKLTQTALGSVTWHGLKLPSTSVTQHSTTSNTTDWNWHQCSINSRSTGNFGYNLQPKLYQMFLYLIAKCVFSCPECPKIDGRLGFAPNPSEWAYSTLHSPETLVDLGENPKSKCKRRKDKEAEKEGNREMGERGDLTCSNSWIDAADEVSRRR